MSRPLYEVKNSYVGTGSLDTYTFDFKIEKLEHLLVVALDDNDVEIQRVKGNDVTYLSSVDFDANNGGGTVVLQADLPANYKLILLLDNDEPVQEFEFNNKSSFTLKLFENALDVLAGAIQRLSYIAKRSIKIHESIDESTFDLTLPPDMASHPNKALAVNATGNGLQLVDTLPGVSAGVTSVNGDSGPAVVLTKSSIGLSNVDNTSDANKPVSTAQQTALNGKADTTHSHVIADVTGLSAALSAKANASHTHAISDVTGLQTVLTDHENRITALEGATPSVDPAISVQNANFNAAYDNAYVIVGTIQAQLPVPVANRRIYFKLDLTAQLTLVRNGSEQIDFVNSNLTLTNPTEAITLSSNGTDWFIF